MRKIDFVCAGILKAGTTTLYEYMKLNKEIIFPTKKVEGIIYKAEFSRLDYILTKEPKFFYMMYNEMPHERFIESYDDRDGICGDMTPYYIISNEFLDRIKNYNPEMKFIYLVRDPMKRLYSELRFKKAFDTLLEVKDENYYDYPINVEVTSHMEDMYDDELKNFMIYNSCYGDNLLRLYKMFPKENVIVLTMEELIKDHNTTINKLFKFLGVSYLNTDEVIHKYKTIYSPNFNEYKIWIDLQKELKEKLYPEMELFYNITGIDYRNIIS